MTATSGPGRDPETSELEVLDEETCWDLLCSQTVGRFAVNRSEACPLVVPVNFVVDGERSIVFRSGIGTKLNATQLGRVAMQVDEIDPLHHTGWSVLVEGIAQWHHEEIDATAVETWAPGDRPYVIRLAPTGITGRRIQLDHPDTDARGYR